jgi:hypothetical protein
MRKIAASDCAFFLFCVKSMPGAFSWGFRGNAQNCRGNCVCCLFCVQFMPGWLCTGWLCGEVSCLARVRATITKPDTVCRESCHAGGKR